MKINFNSISFRLLASFAAMGFITLFLIGFTIIGLGFMVSHTRDVLNVKQPAQTWSLGLARAVNKSNSALQNYIIFDEAKYKEQWKSVWDQEIQQASDSLNSHFEKWNDPESQVIFTQLMNRLQLLQANQDKVINAGAVIASNDDYYDDDEEFEEDDNYSTSTLYSTNSSASIDRSAEFGKQVMPLANEIDQLCQKLYASHLESGRDLSARVNSYLGMFKLVELLMIIAAMAAAWVLYFYLSKKIIKAIDDIKQPINVLSQGNIPVARKVINDELLIVHEELEVLSQNLQNVRSFANEVGQGKFDNDITVFNNSGEIGTSLAGMRDSLKKVAEEDTIRNWTNRGVAEFGDILRQNSDNLDLLADQLLTQLVKYLKANQGSLFVLNDDEEDEKFLELKACYAFDRKKFIQKRVEIGQGLVGQCYLEKETTHLREVPDKYIQITSGLGTANPKFLLIVPLKFNEEVFGVMEIASFHDFKSFEIDFVEKLGESIASSLSTVKINQNTRKLLQESQMMTEQMRSQEEEMRQNMEELQATQEEMERNHRERQDQEEELRENYQKLRSSKEESAYLAQQMQQKFEVLDSATVRINMDTKGVIQDVNTLTLSLSKSISDWEDQHLRSVANIEPANALEEVLQKSKVKIKLELNDSDIQLSGFLVRDSEGIMLIAQVAEVVVSESTKQPAKDERYLNEQLKANAELLKRLNEE